MLAEAIETYHDLLTDSIAADSFEQLESYQSRHHLSFGDRPLCTVLRPRFLTPAQYRLLQQRMALLASAFSQCHSMALEDSKLRSQFRLNEQEEELIRESPGYDCPFPTSRPDAFMVGEDQFLLTEYNAESPAAPAYTDGLTEAFFTLPILHEFQKQYSIRSLPGRPGTLHALLECFRQWSGGKSAKPRIAILDWEDVPTRNEFVLFKEYFDRVGLECQIVTPEEVEYSGGKLRAGNFAIDLIYKRVLVSELLEKGGMSHPVVRAVREKSVCMVNPFQCKMLYKKASLAVLSDERNASLFSEEQLRAIDAHIPWTRVVEERTTTHGGKIIDLVPFVMENRDNLVLKPNDDYGGKGIVLGWTVEESEWQKAVETASSSPYIVQEKIPLPQEAFPSWSNGKAQVSKRMLDTAPFVYLGQYVEGCLTRLATDPLLNVTAGGGSTVPTFVIEKR